MEGLLDLFKTYLIFGGSFLTFIGGFFGITIYLSNRKHPKELDNIPIESLRTGGHFGGLKNFSYPFVRTTLYENFMIIGYWKTIVIPYNQIITLKKSELFGQGFDILTRNKSKFGTPSIWTFNKTLRSKMLTQVKKHGAK